MTEKFRIKYFYIFITLQIAKILWYKIFDNFDLFFHCFDNTIDLRKSSIKMVL